MHTNSKAEQNVETGIPTFPITILGIGNIILQDEGFGVHALKKLEKEYIFKEDVQLLDGGTLGVELIPFLEGTEKLLIFDAVNGGKEPGVFYHLRDKKVLTHYQEKLSVHDIGIQDVLSFMEISGKSIPTVVLLGVEPLCLEMGVGLSPLLEDRLDDFLEFAKKELRSFGVQMEKRGTA